MNSVVTVLIILVMASSTCEKDNPECHKTIKVLNNSNKTIYIGSTSRLYPDTTIIATNPALSPGIYKVNPGETNDRALNARSCLENIINGKTMIFIYDAEVLESTPWDTVIKKNMYLKRHDLSVQDLRNQDWKVVY